MIYWNRNPDHITQYKHLEFSVSLASNLWYISVPHSIMPLTIDSVELGGDFWVLPEIHDWIESNDIFDQYFIGYDLDKLGNKIQNQFAISFDSFDEQLFFKLRWNSYSP